MRNCFNQRRWLHPDPFEGSLPFYSRNNVWVGANNLCDMLAGSLCCTISLIMRSWNKNGYLKYRSNIITYDILAKQWLFFLLIMESTFIFCRLRKHCDLRGREVVTGKVSLSSWASEWYTSASETHLITFFGWSMSQMDSRTSLRRLSHHWPRYRNIDRIYNRGCESHLLRPRIPTYLQWCKICLEVHGSGTFILVSLIFTSL